MLDVLQVGPQRLSTHPLNPCLRHIQPVRELLQLLVLQVHKDLVESGSERQVRDAQMTKQRKLDWYSLFLRLPYVTLNVTVTYTRIFNSL